MNIRQTRLRLLRARLVLPGRDGHQKTTKCHKISRRHQWNTRLLLKQRTLRFHIWKMYLPADLSSVRESLPVALPLLHGSRDCPRAAQPFRRWTQSESDQLLNIFGMFCVNFSNHVSIGHERGAVRTEMGYFSASFLQPCLSDWRQSRSDIVATHLQKPDQIVKRGSQLGVNRGTTLNGILTLIWPPAG